MYNIILANYYLFFPFVTSFIVFYLGPELLRFIFTYKGTRHRGRIYLCGYLYRVKYKKKT
jgi:hypothetical protein